jgi:hypothetical protein
MCRLLAYMLKYDNINILKPSFLKKEEGERHENDS